MTNDIGKNNKEDTVFDPTAKVLWHGERVEKFLKTGKTNPVLIEISPTGYCNANCSWCFFKDKHTSDHINFNILSNALHDLALLGLKAVNWSGGGEPTLYPYFEEATALANKLGLKQGLFTNGYNEIKNQELFSWIRISLTDEGFKVISKPKVKFGICVNHIAKYTESDLIDLCLAARDFGAEYFQIRPALIGNFESQPNLIIPEFLHKYETEDFKVYTTNYKYLESKKTRGYSECYGYHICPALNWNGKLSSCTYLALNEKFDLIDLNTTSILEGWSNIPSFISVTEDCQQCCKNHEINKILYKAKLVNDIDFI